MHVLFADTGVQIVCVSLRGGSRYQTAQIGYGWQRCQCSSRAEDEPPRNYPFIQWQIIQSGTTKMFLAVDTTCGDPDLGYFCEPSALTRDFTVHLAGLLDVQGKPLKGAPEIELCIRPATAMAGDAKHVHMVVDFGNSRTGVLLLELAGEISQTPQMLPFELTNRYHLDAWNEQGETASVPAARWFSSKTHWCNTPFLPPLVQKKTEFHAVGEGEGRPGWFGRGKKPKKSKVEVVVTPPLFDDLSMVRLGREADDVAQVMRAEGDIRTGLSSPKRYLWADDSSWLEGANWHMADPADRCGTGTYASTLKGPLLRYVHEDDRDFLLEEEPPAEHEFANDTPLKPRHAPRCMMTAAIYELLAQAYSYVNSTAYRSASGDAGRTREIRTLSLSYPSGMIQEEQRRLEAQVNKAINIFADTLGKSQRARPELNLGIDEASAVHLTYIWSEMRLLGQDPRLWFATLHQDRGPQQPQQEPRPELIRGAPAGRRRGRGAAGSGGHGAAGSGGRCADSAENLVHTILLPLSKLVGAQEIVLVSADPQGASPGQDVPPVGKAIARVGPGEQVVDDQSCCKLVDRLRDVAGTRPLVQTGMKRRREFSMVPGVDCCILVPAMRQESMLGWLLAVNRLPATSVPTADWQPDPAPVCPRQTGNVVSNLPDDEFGTFETNLLDFAAVVLAAHARCAELFGHTADA